MAASPSETAGNGSGSAAPASAASAATASAASAAPASAPKVETEAPVEGEEAKAEAQPEVKAKAEAQQRKWPGWPGDNVFRLIVPVLKVGSIIGRKGELIKKLCEDTRARVRILEGAIGTTDRIVLISAKEEPETEVCPAMNAALRVFKRVNNINENGSSGTAQAPSGPAVCSIRMLVASSQAINLIGKQGTSIKSIQDSSGAIIRVLPGEELPYYAAQDERVVEILGESLKVLKALEAVLGHLRKFLVDHSVIPLFEKNIHTPLPQERTTDTWDDKVQSLINTSQPTAVGNEYPPSLNRDSLYLEREARLDSQVQRSGLSLYGQDPGLSGFRPLGLGHTAGALVTQVTQTMQVPLSYAEEIIGIGGGNIAYIRRTSGAVIALRESRIVPDEIIVEIKGTSSQVQTAQQLIQDFLSGHKEPSTSMYHSFDTGSRSSYSHLASTGYASSSLPSQSLSGYGSSGLGGYSSYRF